MISESARRAAANRAAHRSFPWIDAHLLAKRNQLFQAQQSQNDLGILRSQLVASHRQRAQVGLLLDGEQRLRVLLFVIIASQINHSWFLHLPGLDIDGNSRGRGRRTRGSEVDSLPQCLAGGVEVVNVALVGDPSKSDPAAFAKVKPDEEIASLVWRCEQAAQVAVSGRNRATRQRSTYNRVLLIVSALLARLRRRGTPRA